MPRLSRLALALPICAAMVAPAGASQSYFDFSFSAEFTTGAYAGTYVISGQTAPGENQAAQVLELEQSTVPKYNIQFNTLNVSRNGESLDNFALQATESNYRLESQSVSYGGNTGGSFQFQQVPSGEYNVSLHTTRLQAAGVLG